MSIYLNHFVNKIFIKTRTIAAGCQLLLGILRSRSVSILHFVTDLDVGQPTCLIFKQGRRNVFEHVEDRFFARVFLFGRSE